MLLSLSVFMDNKMPDPSIYHVLKVLHLNSILYKQNILNQEVMIKKKKIFHFSFVSFIFFIFFWCDTLISCFVWLHIC